MTTIRTILIVLFSMLSGFPSNLYGQEEKERPMIIEEATPEQYKKITKGNKWGLVDLKGKEIIPIAYDQISNLWIDLYYSVRMDGKWGVMDTKGNEVIPLKYDSIVKSFQYGLLRVAINGKWGVINTEGNEVIPLKYGFGVFFSA